MDIGNAITHMRRGGRVERSGWNGKGMWLSFVAANNWACPHAHVYAPDVKQLPWIGMKTADNGFVPWLASQTDLLAEDWEIVS